MPDHERRVTERAAFGAALLTFKSR
jgi:hypothetical protein